MKPVFNLLLALLLGCLLSVLSQSHAQTVSAKTAATNPHQPFTEQQLTAISSLEKIAGDFQISVDESHYQEVPARVKVVCASIQVLWDYRPGIAKQQLRNMIRYLIGFHVENFVEKPSIRPYLRRSIYHAIREMAKKEKLEAQRQLEDFLDAEEGLLSKMNDDEKMELAESLLEVDLSRSIRVAESVLPRTLPHRTISYLSRVKQVSAVLHGSLFGKIVSILSTGFVYSVRDELVLQSYVFKETYLAFPVSEVSDVPGLDRLQFPVGGVIVNERAIFRDQSPKVDEMKAYVSGSVQATRRRMLGINNGFSAAQALFIASKLSAYSELHSDHLQRFTGSIKEINVEYRALATTLGLTAQNIEHLKFMAMSVVINHFGDAVADLANESVDEKTDSFTRMRILENEILRAIGRKEFPSAEKLIFEVKDIRTNQVLTDYLNYSVLVDSATRNPISSNFDERLRKISDQNVKVVALFEIVRALIKKERRDKATEYLFEADQIVSSRLENRAKPQMLVGLLLLRTSLEKKVPAQTLSEVVTSLRVQNTRNRQISAETSVYPIAYQGGSIKLFTQKVADGGIQYTFAASSIESAFESVALINWGESLSYAELIEDGFLRNKAVLSICSLALSPRAQPPINQ